MAQLAKLNTDRGLTQVQAPGCARDTPFGQERFQRHEQVEIDPA
jgi:hypothetical protein